MPTIHWYPGHIAKAERKLKEQLNLIDIILEVIDSRIPVSSRYEGIEKLTGEKPRLLIMSKADLADSAFNNRWQEYLEEKTSCPVILTNTSSPKDLSHIIKEAVNIGKPRINQLIAKGLLPRPLRAMVVGMPNVGKSSIINKLIKTSKVKVGAKAGVTRVSQWVRVNPKLELLDTPGIIPMKLDDQEKAVKLAIVNSISENAYDNMEIAQELVNILVNLYPDLLESHYNIDLNLIKPSLENIAISRNWIVSGGFPDINRCATTILSDFRHGRIGRITLENIPQY
jgi:ribosome biogenesis GTPase A